MNSKALTKTAASAILLLAMASCTPKVVTDISQQMPATEASEVKVYDEGAIVPNSAQVIGRVKVTDTGFTLTKNCKYPIVLDLAKKATAKAGGNALFVRLHQQPNGHSTCHRITCDMLHLTDTIVDPTQANPLMEKAAEEEKSFYEKEDKDNEIRKMPLNCIAISGGYAWLSNEILNEDNSVADSHPKGIDFGIEYSRLFPLKGTSRPLYHGFFVNGLLSLVDCDHLDGYNNYSMQMTNFYIGAGYRFACKTNKRFLWNCGLGIGYAHTEDDMHTNKAGGLGVYGDMGCSYVIGKHFNIGLSMVALSTVYPKPSGWPSNKRYGIDHNALRFKLGYMF